MTRAGIRVLVPILALAATAGTLLGPAAPADAQLAAPTVLAFDQEIRGADQTDVRWPVALAPGPADAPAGELAVADAYQPRILLFRASGKGWTLASAVGLPAAPVGLAWDGGRYLVALRGGRGLMALADEPPALRSVPLPEGVVPGHLAGRPGGGALLYDVAGRRVLRLSAAGEAVAEAPVEGRVTALAASAGGGFFTAVGERGRVRRHAADGSVEEEWNVPSPTPAPAWPAGLAANAGGEVLVVDRHNGRALVFWTDGQLTGVGSRPGWEPGLLRFPSAIAVLPDGRVAVADQGNGRIQIFRRVGKEAGS